MVEVCAPLSALLVFSAIAYLIERTISLKIFSVTAEQIEAKLYRRHQRSMRNKKLSSYDVIGHMVWQL